MSDELKPCPFCGCSDVSMYTNGTDVDDYSYVVECDGCGCTLDTGFESEERAIEEWNRRKEPERKKGKWEDSGWKIIYRCSECGNYLDFSGLNAGRGDANFCPHCGADMRGEE